MTTKLYLLDTENVEARTSVIEVARKTADGEQDSIVLDETIFSPQGGGQPSDQGCISGDFGKFSVEKVRAQGDKIYHYGTGDLPSEGSSVKLEVDKEKRLLYSRLHSAGHALDMAMINIGYPPERLKATKGHHFPGEASVEYEIIGAPLTADEMTELPASLTSEMLNIVEADIETEVLQDISKTEATDMGIRDLDAYPERLRVVKVANCFLPCSGTHVKRSSVIGPVQVTKAKKKKNTLKISYTLQ